MTANVPQGAPRRPAAPGRAGGPGGDVVYDAVVLAGGSARRLGGADKPGVRVGGRALLDRVLDACAGAATTVVVADPRSTARPVTWAREHPPGGGPLAALDAGLRRCTAPAVVVLSADLPFLDDTAVRRLLDALTGTTGTPGPDRSPGPERSPGPDGAPVPDGSARTTGGTAAFGDSGTADSALRPATPGSAVPAFSEAAGARAASGSPAAASDPPAPPVPRPGTASRCATAPQGDAGAPTPHGGRADRGARSGRGPRADGGPGSCGGEHGAPRAPGVRPDGVLLVDPDGREQPLVAVYRADVLRRELAALEAAHGGLSGLPLRRLVAALDLLRLSDPVASFDCDTWDDIATARARIREHGHVLDEWISAVKDELGIDLDVDTGLLLDLARDAAHGVARPAAPLTTFLVGYAAARAGGGPEAVAEASAKATALALRWADESGPESGPDRTAGSAASAPGDDASPSRADAG